MAKLTFESAFSTLKLGENLYGYTTNIDFVIEELENERISKDYFLAPKHDAMLSELFQKFNRSINAISDKQFEFVQILVNKGYKFNARYFDICAFINRFCLSGIHYKIETDPFDNTIRILKFLEQKVSISKDILNDSKGYSYPMKTAMEYFNFGFNKALIKHSYKLEKDNTFRASPIPRIIKYGNPDIIEDALNECRKLKLSFNIKDENGNNLIHWAVLNKKPVAVIKLLRDKYEVNSKEVNKDGKKPSELEEASLFVKRHLK